MYSRNTWDKKDGYSLPPGYDGSRFRRRRRNDGSGQFSGDEVILVPDSSYISLDGDEKDDSSDSGELSVGGIPTDRGKRRQKNHSAFADNQLSEDTQERLAEPCAGCTEETDSPCDGKCGVREKISDILKKLGFEKGLSSDDLLLCAVIFIIASDTERDGAGVGDVLLILALLLGIK